MSPKSDAVAAPAPPKDFDKEIVDMAKYIHGYNVDSDLAVGPGSDNWDLVLRN